MSRLATGHDAEADVLTEAALDLGPLDESLDRVKRLWRRPHLLGDLGNANGAIECRRVGGPKLAQADALALRAGAGPATSRVLSKELRQFHARPCASFPVSALKRVSRFEFREPGPAATTLPLRG